MTVLALLLLWTAIDVTVLVIVNRWRDGIEQRAVGRRIVPPPAETCIGWIEAHRFVRMRRSERG